MTRTVTSRQNLDRLAAAEVPVLPEIFGGQFQTLLPVEGPGERTRKET